METHWQVRVGTARCDCGMPTRKHPHPHRAYVLGLKRSVQSRWKHSGKCELVRHPPVGTHPLYPRRTVATCRRLPTTMGWSTSWIWLQLADSLGKRVMDYRGMSMTMGWSTSWIWLRSVRASAKQRPPKHLSLEALSPEFLMPLPPWEGNPFPDHSEMIQKWIDMAYAADDGSLVFRRGIAVLDSSPC